MLTMCTSKKTILTYGPKVIFACGPSSRLSEKVYENRYFSIRVAHPHVKIDFTCGYECCPYRKIKPGKKIAKRPLPFRVGDGRHHRIWAREGHRCCHQAPPLCRIRREATAPRPPWRVAPTRRAPAHHPSCFWLPPRVRERVVCVREKSMRKRGMRGAEEIRIAWKKIEMLRGKRGGNLNFGADLKKIYFFVWLLKIPV